MLTVIIVFLVFSVLVGAYDWFVFRVMKTRKDLGRRGVRAAATVTDIGSTTGALAVSSTVVSYRFEPEPGKPQENRVVVTSGVYRPQKGDVIEIAYLPEAPKHSEIVGNAGNVRSYMAPLIPLHLLWLALLVAIFLEAFDPGGGG